MLANVIFKIGKQLSVYFADFKQIKKNEILREKFKAENGHESQLMFLKHDGMAYLQR